MLKISHIIKKRLNETNMSLTELAQKTGYSYPHLASLLSGHRRWNETVLSKVCQALNLQLEIKPADDTIPRTAGE